MTPEREAQMREMFEAQASEWGWDLRRETNDPNEYLLMSTAAAWGGFLACARALESMVRDGELYQWLRSQYFAVDFEYQGECVLVFKIPQNTRVRADLDVTIKAAMSAALEDGNANQ